jgi:short-subunit dehydrogenase
MKKTALITGATNGIGLELAKIHALKGGNLVLVARTKSKLEQIKTELEKQYKIDVYIIEKDLSIINAAQEIYNETNKKNIQIQYLINNAGFGEFGMFTDINWDNEYKMIQLNIITLTLLTKLYLKDMVNQKSGKIMNVASTAAFQPGPTMAVYCATKAFVLSFSEAISNELKYKNITITALCPGPTKTGFQAVGKMEESKLFKHKKMPKATNVAKYGYNAMIKGKSVAIYGIMNYVMTTAIRFIPRALVLTVSRKMLDKA